ncbi:13923_t:CDS:2, partial [Gigaspora margarita]
MYCSSFFVSLQVQNNEQYLKDAAYKMRSQLDKYIVSILKDNYMAQKENISLKQKEIKNLCQIVQQDIIIPNFNKISREQVPLLIFYLLIVKQ